MSDWQTALTEVTAALNEFFGESVTIGGTAYTVRISHASADYVEGDNGHQRIYVRQLTVDKSVLGTLIPRGTTVVASDGTYRVRALMSEDHAARTYEVVRS